LERPRSGEQTVGSDTEGGESVSHLTQTGATLEAQINPQGTRPATTTSSSS
jgi:hypothetical protein